MNNEWKIQQIHINGYDNLIVGAKGLCEKTSSGMIGAYIEINCKNDIDFDLPSNKLSIKWNFICVN